MLSTRDVNITLLRRSPQELQDMCLNVIVNNFSAVMFKPSSEHGVRCLRAKRQVILEKFFQPDDSLSLDVLLFCINTHLKKLDLRYLPSGDIPPILRKLEAVESTLTELCLPVDVSLDVLWQFINLLPETIQSLYIRNIAFRDDMLKAVVTRSSRLQKLDLTGTNISDAGINFLCHKDQMGSISKNLSIQELRLYSTKVTRAGVAFALENCPNLSKIQHANINEAIYNMHHDAISSSSSSTTNKTYNLKCVYMENERLPHVDILRAFVFLCPYVTKLVILCISEAAELNACAEFAMLEDVLFGIYGSYNLDEFLESRGKSLKNIIFRCYSESFISAEVIVKCCPKLRCLRLYKPRFTEVKLLKNCDLQYNLPHLAEVIVRNADPDNLEEFLLCILSRSPSLEIFRLEQYSLLQFSPSFMESFIQCCAGMSTLKELRLDKVSDIHKLREAMQKFSLQ